MEQVFCIARKKLETLFSTPLPQGAITGPTIAEVLALPSAFIARHKAETDPQQKQIIPYQLFCCENRYFTYQRGGGVGEQRLSGRCSIGIGGHINSSDTDTEHFQLPEYNRSLKREQQEELICPSDLQTEFIGWINDDVNPVGQVHLGAVHLCRVSQQDMVSIRQGDEDIHQREWMSAEEIQKQQESFEQWSLLALELADKWRK